MLIGYGVAPSDPRDLELPHDLTAALQEWAQIAEAVRRTGDCAREPGVLVSERGRLLAARLASSTGAAVGYADPMASGLEVLTPGQGQEPTPWATGLAVSVASAVLVVVALVTLSQGLASIGVWAVVLANLLAAAGLAPSMWLARSTAVWRWVVYGTAAGFLIGWLILLFSLLST